MTVPDFTALYQNPETGYEVYITDGEDLLTDEQELRF